MSVATNNRLSGYSYDAAGNMLNDGSYSYSWNAEGQMATGAGVTYTYDGDGRGVKKSNGKLYWYGLSADALAESDLPGNLTDEYIFFAGKRIARRIVSSGAVQYYFADHLGTSRVVTNASGTILDDADFYPFGGERVITDTCPQAHKFTHSTRPNLRTRSGQAGKERDTESDLDYFGARFYAFLKGRFQTPDLPFIDQHPTNPQSWNLYHYARNNPINLTDPTGHAAADPNGLNPLPYESYGDITSGDSPTQTAEKVPDRNKEIIPHLKQLAKDFNIPEELALAVAATESAYNVKAENANYKKDKNGQYVLDKNGQKIVDSKDYGLMQVNSSNIGKQVLDSDGKSKLTIGDDIKTDWKANAKAGVALLAEEYRAASKQLPNGTAQEIAQRAYSGYNGGRPNNDRYTQKGNFSGFLDIRDRNFLNNYKQIAGIP